MMNKLKFIFILIGSIILTFSSYAQISPGELSKAHADLEGISNCKKCHELGKKVSSAKCLECHKEIKNLISTIKGYHGSQKISNQQCFTCHNEHHGRNFKITVFNPDDFNHIEAGYLLEGKHQLISCQKCHTSAHIKTPVSKKSGNTYLGLDQDCLSCHKDNHLQSLGRDCRSCHNLDNFKPASGFSHDKTKFPLLGKHEKLNCIKCHPRELQNDQLYQKFSGVKFQNCTNCHQDIHKGKFGSNCKQCHNENSFKSANNRNRFNHDQTGYLLLGKHLRVDCKTCHKGPLTKKINHKKCTDCHSDYHKAEFTKNGIVSDCKECHKVDGFSPSFFTIEKHNKSSFRLKGAHLATPCFRCHKKSKTWTFRNIGERCIDCHADNHNAGISAKFMPEQNCESCHNSGTWEQILFDHNLTDFSLTGKHSKQSCKDCHYKDVPGEKPVQRFKTLSSECTECHEDAHNKQFSNRPGLSCTSCHETDNWKPVLFDHNQTRFPLDGRHQNVECIKCHKSKTNIKTYFQYTLKDISCASCHS